MVRSALVAAVLVMLAGCGGSADVPEETPAPRVPDRRVVLGEVRSPDARSPLVPAREGVWRCPTPGRIQLSISADGEATLIGDRALALVARASALVNRACERVHGPAVRTRAASTRGGRFGASTLRCRAPAEILVDLRGGELTVRADGGARFLAHAAVRPDRIGVAGYWGAGCAPV
jgi:hypothetical protein